MTDAGIYVAASISTVTAMSALGAILCWGQSASDRRLLIAIVLTGLPLSACAFHLIRMPVDRWLSDNLVNWPGLLTTLRICYAPLTEEPAKLLIFCVPWVWRQVNRRNIPQVALAVGLGFGIGEAWMLAELLSGKTEIAGLPWHALWGFIVERALVCFIHAGFTSVALLGLVRRRALPAVLLIGLAMALHFVANFPIYLSGRDLFSLGKGTWSVLLALWVQLLVVMSVLWLARLTGWRIRDFILPGQVRCPGCGIIYKSPLLGVNLLDRRYERCPACMSWHMITAKDRVLMAMEPRPPQTK